MSNEGAYRRIFGRWQVGLNKKGSVVQGVFEGFFRELRAQLIEAGRIMRTREFWIYMGVIFLFMLMAIAGFRLATAFDPITRGQMRLDFTCRTGQGQLATIIVGCFVFGLACVFTLGEVVNWLESERQAKLPGNEHYEVVSYVRPLAHVVGTVVLGVTGYLVLMSWCT